MDEPFAPADEPLDEIEKMLGEIQERREQRVQAILAKARGEFAPRSSAPPAASTPSASSATPPRAPKPPDDAA